jgi:hypothetical protein
MTPKQIEYETKRAMKHNLPLEDWLIFKFCKKYDIHPSKVYEYLYKTDQTDNILTNTSKELNLSNQIIID